jgi:hypothetical protein
MRNVQGNQMLRFQTNLTDIIGFSCPSTFDEAFFVLLTKQGEVKVFNYTIIDTPFAHTKYLTSSGFVRKDKKGGAKKNLPNDTAAKNESISRIDIINADI